MKRRVVYLFVSSSKICLYSWNQGQMRYNHAVDTEYKLTFQLLHLLIDVKSFILFFYYI